MGAVSLAWWSQSMERNTPTGGTCQVGTVSRGGAGLFQPIACHPTLEEFGRIGTIAPPEGEADDWQAMATTYGDFPRGGRRRRNRVTLDESGWNNRPTRRQSAFLMRINSPPCFAATSRTADSSDPSARITVTRLRIESFA